MPSTTPKLISISELVTRLASQIGADETHVIISTPAGAYKMLLSELVDLAEAAPSDADPLGPGPASAGAATEYSRADHVHPAQAMPEVPSASDADPLAPAASAVSGGSEDYSRADHVHPLQAVPVASDADPLANGAASSGSSAEFSRADHTHPDVAGVADAITDGEASATKVETADEAGKLKTTVAGALLETLEQHARTFLQGTNATPASSRELHVQHGEDVGLAVAPRDGMFMGVTSPGDGLPPTDAAARFASLMLGSTTVGGEGFEVIVGSGDLSEVVTFRFEVAPDGTPTVAIAAGSNALLLTDELTRISGPFLADHTLPEHTAATLTLESTDAGGRRVLNASSNPIEIEVPNDLPDNFSCVLRVGNIDNPITFASGEGLHTVVPYGKTSISVVNTFIYILVEDSNFAVATITEPAT